MQVLASNMIFLGVIILLPFSLGRFMVYFMSWLFINSPVLSKVMPLADSALTLANITLKNSLTALTNLSSDGQEGIIGQVAEVLNSTVLGLNEVSTNATVHLSGDLFNSAHLGTSRLTDVTTLAIGYLLIFFGLIVYLGIISLIRYTRGEPLTMGRYYGIASIAETIPSLFRQFVAAMRHLMTMIKVAFLLVIELGVFPLMCGWWLDICTIRMFGKTMSHRVQFFSVSPLASSLVHWVVGIVYMLQISIFVSLLRGVCTHFYEPLLLLFQLIETHNIPFPSSVDLFCRFCGMEFYIFYEIQLIQTIIHSGILLMILCTSTHAGSCSPWQYMVVSL